MNSLSFWKRALIYLFWLAVPLFLSRCKKKEKLSVSVPDPFVFYQLAQDIARAESDLYYITDLIRKVQNLPSRRLTESREDELPPCARVEIDTLQRRVIIDFGSEGCVDRDSLLRQGRIIADFSGNRWGEPGARVLITTDSFFVEDRFHLLERVLFTEASQGSGAPIFRDTVQRHRMVMSSGTLDWRSIRFYQFAEGYQTPTEPADDTFFVQGEGSGTSRSGHPFIILTLDPLKFASACRYPYSLKGELKLRMQETDILLSYDPQGNGACDNLISIRAGSLQPVTVRL
ncbi:MAG: hypothetical protein RMK19_06875 [Bacteroidia bacterium]|nr:hypothetical protein [Bacteroidia bacterium]MDW8015719.1 hypothetical protein [Bacteroidia bacterium]